MSPNGEDEGDYCRWIGLHSLRRYEKELDINIPVDIFLQCGLNYGPAPVFNKHKTRPKGPNELLKANKS